MISSQRLECRAKFFFLGENKFYVKGVTYGPFRPESQTPDLFLPSQDKIKRDLEIIRRLGANTLRIYHVPPRWFLDLLGENNLYALVTVPWQQHFTFLDHRKTRQDIKHHIRQAAEQCAQHPALLGLLIGNEIPSDMVRWYGARKIQNFLADLIATVKTKDENLLVSYASYPPTEYLIPRFADFLTYNVYLHRQLDLQNYLARLQNLAEEKPLILGEFGMDTQRHSQTEQAEMLTWHVETVVRAGLAGTVLFSFTDEWFTGGHDITDWAFGLVTRERSPKLAYHAIQKLWQKSGALIPLPQTPKVSIVVCSYNGGKTLKGALESLDQLNYPHYEIILIDDGSKDNTQELVKQFERERSALTQNPPPFKNIIQPNRGLSAARNNGIHTATGDIVAFTDSDCIADRDWLYYLVNTLLQGNFAAVGGPNISPPAHNWIQACVAAAPGSPSHVLISDTMAEHVPGCNMAYWKWALLEIDGFDAEYRKAGDDVDVCWRLMQRGHHIGFSPSAIVWHHRRFTVQAYFKQQSGYGEAEALLRFKHLIYFAATGGAKWRGTVYGTPRFEHIFSGPIIYHGTFGMGLFQCIYPRPEAVWSGIVSSLEWVLFTLFIFLLSWKIAALRLLPLIMIGLTLAAGASWMARARLEPKHDSILSRLLLLYLAMAQPLVRTWARYFTWLKHKCTPAKVIASKEKLRRKIVQITPRQQAFWSEKGQTREILLNQMLHLLETQDWKYSIDVGWSDWDLLIFGNRWWHLKIKTASEYHGGPKVLTRVLQQLKLTAFSFISFLVILTLLWLGTKSLYAMAAAILIAFYLLYNGYKFQKRIAVLTEAAAEQCQLLPLKKNINPKA